MADRDLHPSYSAFDYYDEAPTPARRTSPGKRTLTSQLQPPPFIFRVADLESARALAGFLGPRDANGVAANAAVAVDAAAQSSGARGLPDQVRAKFEDSLGIGLSDVKVHADGESARAASALGARAYTVGRDIYFNDGEYDPTSTSGEHLLAHEVAHTAQQSGETPRPQMKLQVSTPGDASETAADRAADAMVRGETAAVSSASSTVVRRVPDECSPEADQADRAESEKCEEASAEDKEWATKQKAELAIITTEVNAAKGILSTEVAAVLAVLDQADEVYTGFKKKYDKASEELRKKFKKALDAGAQKRAAIDFFLRGAIAVATGGVSALYKTAGIVQQIVANATKSVLLAAARGKMQNKSTSTPPGGEFSGDWRGLFRATLASYKSYVAFTNQLDSAIAAIAGETATLDQIIGGNAKSIDKSRVEEMAEAKGQFSTISAGCLTSGVSSIKQAIADVRAIPTSKIKQDLAIEWMAGLSAHEIEAIDDTDGELKDLGVIDKKDNRLGYDTGDYTSDDDQRMVWLRAQVEHEVMGVVGSVMRWQGNGRARGGPANKLWVVSGVDNSYPKNWGVRCVGYTKPSIALPDQNGGKDEVYRNMYRSQYTLHVTAIEDKGEIPNSPEVSEG